MSDVDGIQDLVDRAKAGDSAAIAELLETLRPRIRRLASQYTQSANDASTSDLVQEAWVRAWSKLEQFQGGADDAETRAMLVSWIDQIVRRIGLNAVRDRKALKRKPAEGKIVPLKDEGTSTVGPGARGVAASDPSPSSIARHGEHAKLVHDAIEALPDAEDRSIVRLRFIDGLSLKDIAEQTGHTYDQVRTRFQRSMASIERRLGGLQ